MKQVLLFFFVLVMMGSTYVSGDNRLEFIVKEARKDTVNHGQARVSLELKNLTDDTLVFLTWTCDPFFGLLSIDGQNVFLDQIGCDQNGPTFLNLLPHSSYQETVYMRINKPDTIIPAFRVRINLIEPKEKYNIIKAYEATNETDKKQFSLLTDYIQIK
jgi:hypothetical protein